MLLTDRNPSRRHPVPVVDRKPPRTHLLLPNTQRGTYSGTREQRNVLTQAIESFVARRYLRRRTGHCAASVTLFLSRIAAGSPPRYRPSMNTGSRNIAGSPPRCDAAQFLSRGRAPAEFTIPERKKTVDCQMCARLRLRSITVLLSFSGQTRGVVTKGVDPERERRAWKACNTLGGKWIAKGRGIDVLLIGKQLPKMENGLATCHADESRRRLTPSDDAQDSPFPWLAFLTQDFFDTGREPVLMTLTAAQGISGAGDLVNALGISAGASGARAGNAMIREIPEKNSSPPPGGTNRALFERSHGKTVTAILSASSRSFGLNILWCFHDRTDKARDIAVLMSWARAVNRFANFLWRELHGATGTVGLVLVRVSLIAGIYRIIRWIRRFTLCLMYHSSQHCGWSLDHSGGDGHFGDATSARQGCGALIAREFCVRMR